MRRARGFTLIEAVLALGIVALILGLVTGWSRVMLAPLRTDPSELYTTLAVLEHPGRFTVKAVHDQSLELTESVPRKRRVKVKTVLLMVDTHHVLKITSLKHRGYSPLLRRVAHIHFQKTRLAHLVRLKIKQEGQPWQKTILVFHQPGKAS